MPAQRDGDLLRQRSFHRFSLTERERQVCLGTLLGDGYISAASDMSQNARITMRHGLPQKAYCRWKYNELSRWCATPPKIVENRGLGKWSVFFQTRSHPQFTDLRDMLIHKGRKTVTLDYLSQLSGLAVAVWYMDDGSLENFSMPVFHTEGYSKAECHTVASWLVKRWGIKAAAKAVGPYWVVKLYSGGRQQFADLVQEFIHPSMQYKMDIPVLGPRTCALCGATFYLDGVRGPRAHRTWCDKCKPLIRKEYYRLRARAKRGVGPAPPDWGTIAASLISR